MESTQWIGSNKDGSRDWVCGPPAPGGYFFAYTTVGIASGVAAATSAPLLYNPPASSPQNPNGVVLRIQQVSIGCVSGSLVAGSILYGLIPPSAVLSGLTPGPTPINAFFGRGNATFAQWYTGVTSSVVPTIIPNSGFSIHGAFTTGKLFTLQDRPRITLPPGWGFYPFLANAAGAPNLTALITVDYMQQSMYSNY